MSQMKLGAPDGNALVETSRNAVAMKIVSLIIESELVIPQCCKKSEGRDTKRGGLRSREHES